MFSHLNDMRRCMDTCIREIGTHIRPVPMKVPVRCQYNLLPQQHPLDFWKAVTPIQNSSHISPLLAHNTEFMNGLLQRNEDSFSKRNTLNNCLAYVKYPSPLILPRSSHSDELGTVTRMMVPDSTIGANLLR